MTATRSTREFILMMAATMSLLALCVDSMLPAFAPMATDLGVESLNNMQLVIGVMFIGMALGQLFYGPLSDSVGRLRAIHAGFLLMLVGSLICMFSNDFTEMLVGRFLQGFGAAGPRTVALALVRDRFQGSEMARIMSFIVTTFILVPVLAPSVGQLILIFADWRAIFGFIIVFSTAVQIWVSLRQSETLMPADRRPFTMVSIGQGFREVLGNAPAMVYTLVAGCIFGSLMGYINSSQQIFQVLYGQGRLYPVLFGCLALAGGVASLLNGTLVMRLGMQLLTSRALYLITILSWLLLLLTWWAGGKPPLWQFMLCFGGWFFFMGIIFGNINALAMEELGHVAGSAAAVIGTIYTLVAILIGLVIGALFNDSLYPMASGLAVLSTVSLLLVRIPAALHRQQSD